MPRRAYIYVPNYDGTGTADRSPHSYLLLGTVATEAARDGSASTPWPGSDLLKAAGFAHDVGFFMDDDIVTNRGERNQQTAGTSYHRYKTGSTKDTIAYGGVTSPSQTLTNELVSRGGWRDHTDGNRVVTTRGDRVDFIQGNYKRVVFGRVTGSGATGSVGTSTWESSGGHNHDSTTTPGEVMSISWVNAAYSNSQLPREGGTWRVVEKTTEGNEITRYSGKVVDKFYGPYQRSVTGRWPADPAPFPAPNASADVALHDHAAYALPTPSAARTDAGAIDITKSPIIDEKTYATTITGNTTFDTSVSYTTVLTKISGTTTAKHIKDDTGSSSQRINTVRDHQALDDYTTQEFYCFKFDHSRGGTVNSENYFHTLTLSGSAIQLAIFVGAQADINMGSFGIELNFEPLKAEFVASLELNMWIGAAVDITLGKKGGIEVNSVDCDVTLGKLTGSKFKNGVASSWKSLCIVKM